MLYLLYGQVTVMSMARMLRLEIRLNEKEYAKIKAEAEKRGVSMADILREPIRFLPEV